MSTPFELNFSDPADWRLINRVWEDDAGTLRLVGDYSGDPDAPLQGMHFAFHRGICCRDATFDFELNLQSHSDAGVIFRARDASHFYLLHFPNCGQHSRAQHFWVALSAMDASGWLRRVRMSMVRGVPSTSGVWLSARVRVERSRIEVRVGDYGHVAFEDVTYADPGHVGVYGWRAASLRHVRVACDDEAPGIFNVQVTPRVNWQTPAPNDNTWQQPTDLKHLGDGELVMQVNLQRVLTAGEDAVAVPHLMRSSDAGRTWSEPERIHAVTEGYSWSPPRMHLTPGGRLLLLVPGPDHKKVFESNDGGRTWTPQGTTNLHVGPAREKPVQDLSPAGFLNLRDGSILALQLSAAYLNRAMNRHNIWTWGGSHCQAFTSRSSDDGRTWSEPVNVDNPGADADGNPLPGNLDLTEASGFETTDGRVVLLIRPIYSPWMWQTWSDDGGRTWGPAVRGPFPGYAAPNMVRTVSGAVIFAHRMPGLCLHVTRDEGCTWDEGTTIDSSLWAMGSMVEVEPEVVLYVYWDSDYKRMRAQRVRVTAKELLPG